jgi:uncharacterized protein YecT (DUF1311 family)
MKARYQLSLLSLALMATTIVVQSTDSFGDDDHLLVLNTSICQGDMHAIGQCLNRQNEKADQWLQAVVESYASLEAAYMSEDGRTEPFGLVAQLRESQVAFEHFRDATAELVYRTGFPSDTGLKYEAAKARFRLTIERARFLLDTCGHPGSMSVDDVADLTVSDWCQSK